MDITVQVAEQEFELYYTAKENLAHVTRGGKDYSNCSFTDISIRRDRLKTAKDELCNRLGKLLLKQLEEK